MSITLEEIYRLNTDYVKNLLEINDEKFEIERNRGDLFYKKNRLMVSNILIPVLSSKEKKVLSSDLFQTVYVLNDLELSKLLGTNINFDNRIESLIDEIFYIDMNHSQLRELKNNIPNKYVNILRKLDSYNISEPFNLNSQEQYYKKVLQDCDYELFRWMDYHHNLYIDNIEYVYSIRKNCLSIIEFLIEQDRFEMKYLIELLINSYNYRYYETFLYLTEEILYSDEYEYLEKKYNLFKYYNKILMYILNSGKGSKEFFLAVYTKYGNRLTFIEIFNQIFYPVNNILNYDDNLYDFEQTMNIEMINYYTGLYLKINEEYVSPILKFVVLKQDLKLIQEYISKYNLDKGVNLNLITYSNDLNPINRGLKSDINFMILYASYKGNLEILKYLYETFINIKPMNFPIDDAVKLATLNDNVNVLKFLVDNIYQNDFPINGLVIFINRNKIRNYKVRNYLKTRFNK